MKGLDARTLRRLVERAADRLAGDWVVIGGAVLPLLGVAHRVTVDVDVAGPDDAGTKETILLLEIAASLGLPVETVNPVGAFFLRRVRGWREDLVELHRGRLGRVLVPNATLFVILKIGRLTEADLSDCLEMLKLARRRKDDVDRARLGRALRKALRGDVSAGRRQRLERLREALAPRR